MIELVTDERAGRVRASGAPSWARLIAVFGGAAGTVALLLAAARALAPVAGPAAGVASIVAGALAILLVGSLAEWVVHGRLMHTRTRLPVLALAYDLHHRAHHWIHYRPDAYLKDRVTYVGVLPPRPKRATREPVAALTAIVGQALFYAVFALPLSAGAWLVTANAAFTATFVAGATTIIVLAIHLHDSIHCPGHSRLERARWFRWLDRHHYVHHVDTRANVNFLLPLGDLLLGTLRRELSAAELERWPTHEDARAVVHPAN
jgi:hypothetical protein